MAGHADTAAYHKNDDLFNADEDACMAAVIDCSIKNLNRAAELYKSAE